MTDIVYDPFKKVGLDVFLNEIMLEMPELPDEIAMHYIRRAAIEFAERTRVLKRTVEICTEPCVGNYIIEPPDCTDMVSIHSICADSCCPSAQVIKLNHRPCFLHWCHSSAYLAAPDEIVFAPAPTKPTNFTVVMSVKPKQDACEVDEILYTKYQDAVQYGARYRLYGIPRKAWSSMPQSQAHRLEFDRRVAAANNDRLLGGMQGVVKIRGRRYL